MFFMRLRRGAKWVFVLLVFAFAFGFLFSGVGGGGGGDIIEQLLGLRGGSDPLKTAQAAVKAHPKVIQNWNSLAQAYEAKQLNTKAIGAYEHVLKLKPGDQSTLSQIGGIWETLTYARYSNYTNVQQELHYQPGPLRLQQQSGTDVPGLERPPADALPDDAEHQGHRGVQVLHQSGDRVGDHEQALLNTVPKSDKAGRAIAEETVGRAALYASDTTAEIVAFKEYLRLLPHSPDAPVSARR